MDEATAKAINAISRQVGKQSMDIESANLRFAMLITDAMDALDVLAGKVSRLERIIADLEKNHYKGVEYGENN